MPYSSSWANPCSWLLPSCPSQAYIAAYIRGKCSFQIILLGGICQPEPSHGWPSGPAVRGRVFRQPLLHRGRRLLRPHQLYKPGPYARCCCRDMARQAEQVVVLTESEKFSRRGVVPLNLPQTAPPQPRIVVTNRIIPENVLASLQAKGIEAILVE